ncbi:MAG TPA: ferritin-like domain-containing protein [Aeromicrobium sp.]|nr:ferritin-like domain-containing protein [Aeromicrobium sp.]
MTELKSLQTWLALEHESIWIYQLIGARVSELTEPATTQAAAHRQRRNQLSKTITALGGKPVGTQLSYDVAAVKDKKSAQLLARGVEARIAAACVGLVAVTEDNRRALAIDGIRTAALTQVRWGGSAEPFPGLD